MNQASGTREATFQAGAATADLTPQGSVFLFGYPHAARHSTGVHDRLESSALFLRSRGESVLFIANDLIFVTKTLAAEVRRRISARTGIPVCAIVVTATHTHSGPVMVDYVSNGADHVVPKANRAYLAFVAESMISAGCSAVQSAVPAEIGLAVAQANGVGTNRHDPQGPADPGVPVLVVRSLDKKTPLACMVAYAMHPTVLHEDSTLISGDFPHFTRCFLRTNGILPDGCPVLYHNGASGNQSPRHMTRANTMAEAQRLGEKLGQSIAQVISSMAFRAQMPLYSRCTFVELKLREFPSLEMAMSNSLSAGKRFESLRTKNASRVAVRTAECDWFGAEETVELARAAADGKLEAIAKACSPAEIQVITVGPWKFVMWPGEFFVEYALELKSRRPNTFIITLANGELQGYIVTPEAASRGVYEATNAIFCPSNGKRMVATTLQLLG